MNGLGLAIDEDIPTLRNGLFPFHLFIHQFIHPNQVLFTSMLNLVDVQDDDPSKASQTPFHPARYPTSVT